MRRGLEERAAQARLRAKLFGQEFEPVRVGRFAVLTRIGSGAMGEVFAGYDDTLDRKVAIKLIAQRASGRADAPRRMLREAQALARLSHPNVVQVYEAGMHEGRLFIAMEFVEGRTLRQWASGSDAPHPWREVLRVYREAGRGLAAAHEAGLVHRDFKPDNAMIDGRGQVRVMDFGLARGTQEAAHIDTCDDVASTSAPTAGPIAGATLTRTGAVLGTPLYMSPEQYDGKTADASSDQFSHCVALWEALYGQRPFHAESLADLVHTVMRGELHAPPRDSRVPGWVRRALERGLSVDSADRWSSMKALLDALDADPAKRRRRSLMAVAGLGLVGLCGAGGHAWVAARAERCAGARAQLQGVWDDVRRAEVRTAVLGIAASFAESVWVRVAAGLDRYATDWTAMHTEACEASTIRREQSAETMDLRMACLHRAKVELEAVTGVLANADTDVVHKAHELVDGLRPLARCADPEALKADVEPPGLDEAHGVEQIRAHLAIAKAEREAGRHTAAQAQLEQAKLGLAGVEYGPVHTEVALADGQLLQLLGHYEASEAALQKALRLASSLRQWSELQAAAATLVFVVGYQQQRMEEGLRYRNLAEGLAKGNPGREATVWRNVANVLRAQGKYEQAQVVQQRALAALETSLGPEHPDVAAAREGLAVVYAQQGHNEKAEVEFLRALALREKALGPEHPDVAQSRHNVATVRHALGKYEESAAEFRRALPLLENALGPEHPNVATLRSNIGGSLRAQGKLREAEAEFLRALAIEEKTLGRDHPAVARLRLNLAITLMEQGRHDEAEAEHRRALALLVKALGPEHPDIAISRNNLGRVLFKQGKYEEAEAEHRRALEGQEKALGSEHPDVALLRGSLAEVALERGKVQEALRLAEQAWARRQRDDIPAKRQASSAFLLARSLWAASTSAKQRARARALARTALDAYHRTGDAHPERAAQVRAWLDAREKSTSAQRGAPGG